MLLLVPVHAGVGLDVQGEEGGPAAGAGGVLCHHQTPGGGDNQAPSLKRDAHRGSLITDSSESVLCCEWKVAKVR